MLTLHFWFCLIFSSFVVFVSLAIFYIFFSLTRIFLGFVLSSKFIVGILLYIFFISSYLWYYYSTFSICLSFYLLYYSIFFMLVLASHATLLRISLTPAAKARCKIDSVRSKCLAKRTKTQCVLHAKRVQGIWSESHARIHTHKQKSD